MFRLHNVSKCRLQRLGLKKLSLCLAEDEETLVTFPKRANGRALLLREGWMARVIKEDVAFRDAPDSDCSAGQGDIQYLTLTQALRIRANNLNFVKTESVSMTAHCAFLDMLDKRIFKLLGARMLESLGLEPVPEKDWRREVGVVKEMMQLGMQCASCAGAQTFIECSGGMKGSPIPDVWAVEMTYSFSGHRIVFLNCTKGTCSFEQPEDRCWIVRDFSRNELSIVWDIKNLKLNGEKDQVKKEVEMSMGSFKKKAILSNELLAELTVAIAHLKSQNELLGESLLSAESLAGIHTEGTSRGSGSVSSDGKIDMGATASNMSALEEPHSSRGNCDFRRAVSSASQLSVTS